MKKHVLFVNDEFETGGVTSVLLNLLNELDKEKYDIDLLILSPHGKKIDNLPRGVKLVKTDPFFSVCDIPIKECLLKGPIYTFRKIRFYLLIKSGLMTDKVKKIRKKMKLEEYDTEVAFKEGFSSIFVAASECKNKINWIHSDYKVVNYSKNYDTTIRKVFKQFNYHVAVSKRAAQSFREIFFVDNVRTIHNIINTQRIESLKEEKNDYEYPEGIRLISVGRLHPQKAYSRLLDIIAKLNKDNYNFSLTIIGDGPLKEELLAKKEELQLNNVYFLLQKNNPFSYLKNADLFVLASFYEGLPTVVYESLICEVPVFTASVAGVEEQLTTNIGVIVDNDEESIYRGLKDLLDNPDKIFELKDNLKGYRYENEEIIKEIEGIL